MLREVVRQVVLDAPYAYVVVHHPSAAHGLEEGLDLLPVPERVHDRSHGPNVQPHCPEEEKVAGYAVQLAHEHADVLRSLGDLQAHELLRRHAEDQLVVEVGYVVQAVEQGDYLGVKLPLAQLLRASVEVPNMRLNVHNALSVHPEKHTEDAVSAGVLRPHVDHHLDHVQLVLRAHYVTKSLATIRCSR